MKKTFICLAAAALVVGLNFRASTSSSQPPAGYTGAPGESTCATSGCHSGNLNTGPGSVTLINPPANYIPGQIYPIQIQVDDATKSKFGFELVALNSSNNQAGTISLSNTVNTAVQTNNLKSYASHKNASLNNIWTFNWHAPANNIGAVRFFFSGNAANGDGNTTGDNIYTGTFTLNPLATTGLKEEAAAAVKVFPNPAAASLNLELPNDANHLTVLDLSGREIFSRKETPVTSELDVSQYPNGTYFIKVDQERSSVLKRFVVQH
jgi:hypothetical protein